MHFEINLSILDNYRSHLRFTSTKFIDGDIAITLIVVPMHFDTVLDIFLYHRGKQIIHRNFHRAKSVLMLITRQGQRKSF